MAISSAVAAFKSSKFISWKPTGLLQQTLAGVIERSGTGLHSGKVSTVKLWPESAGKGRFFCFKFNQVQAAIDNVEVSPLCTTLTKNGFRIRTVEHLLSALEATGVDNCRIEIINSDASDCDVEVPIFDGSAGEWVDAINKVGLEVATDVSSSSCEKMAPYVNEPVHVWRNDSFLAAFPAAELRITCGIDFPQVPQISHQWFSTTKFDHLFYAEQIASARTFCIYEEVERMRNRGLIRGGTLENAIVCSSSRGWLNPPLRFHDEPCRHKLLDLIGDLSLLAQSGSRGLPAAHIVAYKAGHALHAEFVRCLTEII